MSDIKIMTFPVYRLDRKKYYEQRENFVQQQQFNGTEYDIKTKKDFYKQCPENEAAFRNHLEKLYGGSWEYNEIVGFIELYFLGDQVRGEYWQVDAKRITKTRHKQFQYQTHKLAPEITIPFGSSDMQIFECICEYLEDCKKELKKFYIDCKEFYSIGLFIKWNELISSKP